MRGAGGRPLLPSHASHALPRLIPADKRAVSQTFASAGAGLNPSYVTNWKNGRPMSDIMLRMIDHCIWRWINGLPALVPEDVAGVGSSTGKRKQRSGLDTVEPGGAAAEGGKEAGTGEGGNGADDPHYSNSGRLRRAAAEEALKRWGDQAKKVAPPAAAESEGGAGDGAADGKPKLASRRNVAGSGEEGACVWKPLPPLSVPPQWPLTLVSPHAPSLPPRRRL